MELLALFSVLSDPPAVMNLFVPAIVEEALGDFSIEMTETIGHWREIMCAPFENAMMKWWP